MSKKCYDINFYELTDKKQNTRDMVEYMINRTMSMFKWDNLPDTINQRTLELYLQTHGFVLLTYHEEQPYIYYGGLGGEPDVYYRPTIATIANPAQNFTAQLTIGWDKGDTECECVIGLNDILLKGLLPLHQKYASEMAENELSMWLSNVLARMPWLLSAQDDKTQKSAEEFLKNIFEGKLGVVTDSAFLDGIKEHVLSNSNHQILASLIQLNQYYKASWYNELGLNAMQNGMKKEAISDSEEQMNQDILKPFITTMLECRKDFCERVNERFGLDISVDLDSSWLDNEEELELMQEQEESEVLDDDSELRGTGDSDSSSESDSDTVSDNDNTDLDSDSDNRVEEIIEESVQELKEAVEDILNGEESETDIQIEEEEKDE